MLLGIFTTLLILETKRITLEKLSGELDFEDENVTGTEIATPEPDSEVSKEKMADDSGAVKPGDKSL